MNEITAGAGPFDSFEQERREVIETVFEAFSRGAPDADEMAACAFLMRHLTSEPGPRTTPPAPVPTAQSAPRAATRSLRALRTAAHYTEP